MMTDRASNCCCVDPASDEWWDLVWASSGSVDDLVGIVRTPQNTIVPFGFLNTETTGVVQYENFLFTIGRFQSIGDLRSSVASVLDSDNSGLSPSPYIFDLQEAMRDQTTNPDCKLSVTNEGFPLDGYRCWLAGIVDLDGAKSIALTYVLDKNGANPISYLHWLDAAGKVITTQQSTTQAVINSYNAGEQNWYSSDAPLISFGISPEDYQFAWNKTTYCAYGYAPNLAMPVNHPVYAPGGVLVVSSNEIALTYSTPDELKKVLYANEFNAQAVTIPGVDVLYFKKTKTGGTFPFETFLWETVVFPAGSTVPDPTDTVLYIPDDRPFSTTVEYPLKWYPKVFALKKTPKEVAYSEGTILYTELEWSLGVHVGPGFFAEAGTVLYQQVSNIAPFAPDGGLGDGVSNVTYKGSLNGVELGPGESVPSGTRFAWDAVDYTTVCAYRTQAQTVSGEVVGSTLEITVDNASPETKLLIEGRSTHDIPTRNARWNIPPLYDGSGYGTTVKKLYTQESGGKVVNQYGSAEEYPGENVKYTTLSQSSLLAFWESPTSGEAVYVLLAPWGTLNDEENETVGSIGGSPVRRGYDLLFMDGITILSVLRLGGTVTLEQTNAQGVYVRQIVNTFTDIAWFFFRDGTGGFQTQHSWSTSSRNPIYKANTLNAPAIAFQLRPTRFNTDEGRTKIPLTAITHPASVWLEV